MTCGVFPKALVQYSPERRELNLELRDYLYKNLYYNPVVIEPNQRALKMLEAAFQSLSRASEGNRQRRATPRPQTGLYRAVCDYLAGMTDRYVVLEHQRLFGETLKA